MLEKATHLAVGAVMIVMIGLTAHTDALAAKGKNARAIERMEAENPGARTSMNRATETVSFVRLKKGGGHGGHNGLRDVIRHCGKEFMRLRVGVGHPGEKDKVTGYVLKRASSDVEAVLQKSVDAAVDIVPVLVERGLEEATKALHTKSD